MQRILVLGAGFAGLWAAIGAARALDERGIGPDRIEVMVLNASPFHCIRVRNYETDLSQVRVPLADVLEPIGVRWVVGDVTGVHVTQRCVTYNSTRGAQRIEYDRLVFALGSQVARPPVAGLSEHSFDIDTYEAAERLSSHLAGLAGRKPSPGRETVLVVGAGLTGIELASELPNRLQSVFVDDEVARPRVILADHASHIGSNMGNGAGAVIAEALSALGVETRPGVSVAGIDADGATLADGERIAAATVVWCAGMVANQLTACLPVPRDRAGRLPVAPTLKIQGLDAEFAAGDAAWCRIDGEHLSVMSCQHARPMGRFAGYNVVADLLGEAMLPLSVDWYTTILDLGPWGAVYTEGWDRMVVAQRDVAKRTKEIINRERIYPPLTRERRAILQAAAPVVQAPPAYGGGAARPG
ncbi:MAG: FAD-dependent oxidoreductase [Acetobacteraceae bacterium]